MGSANCKAIAFAAMLMLAVPGLSDAPADTAAPSSVTPAAELADSRNDQERSGEADQEEGNLFAQPWFSTLGALVLGLLGLLWMRRRAAEL